MKRRVLVVGTSREAKGGINSVINAYSQSDLWNRWECYWLESHTDKSKILKMFYFIGSLIKFVFILPNYSIVHLHLSEAPSAFRKSFFLKIAKLFKKIVIVHFHSYSIETTIDGKYQRLYYNLFSSSDKVLVLSTCWENWIIQKWPDLSEKIEVLYNPCPVIVSETPYPKSNTILYAGALNSRKGYMDLIKAFSLISKSNVDWKLVFAGNGEMNKAKNMVASLNLENQILFKGWVSGIIKDELFKSASIFCLPSFAEGFPMAVLEAWAFGLPVITTKVGGLEDIVKDGINASVIIPGDSEGIAAAIQKLIIDGSLRNKLSIEALMLSKTIFSLREVTERLDFIYKKVIHSN